MHHWESVDKKLCKNRPIRQRLCDVRNSTINLIVWLCVGNIACLIVLCIPNENAVALRHMENV